MCSLAESGDRTLRYIIIDLDTGSDDAWALFMLVKAEENWKYKLKILGIVCTHGNSALNNVVVNTIRVLRSLNRLDIPIFLGAENSILENTERNQSNFHKTDGFGDVQFDGTIDTTIVQKTHAVTAIYEFVNKFPQQITFMLLAPLTTYALCLNLYGSKFADKIKDVYVMGGNMRGQGNVTKCAEFNFYLDPEAAFITLNKSKCPITLLPWESCINVPIDLDWRIDVLGSISHPFINILNPVEISCYRSKGFSNWIPCDAFLTAVFLSPEKMLKEITPCYATVELSGNHTRGQVVFDHMIRDVSNNINLIREFNAEHFKELCLWMLGHNQKNLDEL